MLGLSSYRAGEEISRARVEAAGDPVRVVLLPEETETSPDGLLFAAVELQDAEGRRVPWAEPLLTASARRSRFAALVRLCAAAGGGQLHCRSLPCV
ncbi:MAG: hypothetical protein ACLU9S_21355 [Oscillospiraceae bacterium]